MSPTEECDVTPLANWLYWPVHAYLTDVWVAENAPWLDQLTWSERLVEWFRRHIHITGPKDGEK